MHRYFNVLFTMIIYTPTFKDYVDVVQSTLDLGMTWSSGGSNVNTDAWKTYGVNTCILIENDSILWYCVKEFAITEYPEIKIINKEEFLKYISNRFKNKYDLK